MQRVLSPVKINAYVRNQFAGRNELPATQYPLENAEDFVKIIYIRLYGQRKNMDYTVELREEKERNGYRFEDFLVLDGLKKELQKLRDALQEQTEERKKLLASVKQLNRQVVAYKKQMYDKVQLKSAQVQLKLNEAKAERLELDKKIEQLRQKKLTYPEDVVRVRQAIQEEFSGIGRSPEPRILCELLEITDEKWSSAVEGY